jgi:hypothetical protein
LDDWYDVSTDSIIECNGSTLLLHQGGLYKLLSNIYPGTFISCHLMDLYVYNDIIEISRSQLESMEIRISGRILLGRSKERAFLLGMV